MISNDWTSNLAYAVGLIATDGNLSKDNRHFDFTSKDLEQVQTIARVLNLKNNIGLKTSSYGNGQKYFRIQWGDVNFYKFLESIGLTSNKSKTMGTLMIPDVFFPDFLRGCLDGDGGTYSYWDPRWKSSFMLYTQFTSGSYDYLLWLNKTIKMNFGVEGRIGKSGATTFNLRFAKAGSVVLIEKMYYKKELPMLKRKYLKCMKSIGIIRQQAGVLELVYRHA